MSDTYESPDIIALKNQSQPIPEPQDPRYLAAGESTEQPQAEVNLQPAPEQEPAQVEPVQPEISEEEAKRKKLIKIINK